MNVDIITPPVGDNGTASNLQSQIINLINNRKTPSQNFLYQQVSSKYPELNVKKKKHFSLKKENKIVINTTENLDL